MKELLTMMIVALYSVAGWCQYGMTLKSAVCPTSLEDQTMTWKSSGPTIVNVTTSGKIGD
jgi:hypothetical protein